MAEKLETLFIELRTDQKKLKKELKTLRKRTDREAKTIGRSFGTSFGKGFAAVGGFLALITGLKAGLRSLRAFDKGLRNVNTIFGVSEKRLKRFRDELRQMQKRLGTPGSELTGALYQLASAGVTAKDSMAVLNVAVRASIAGLTTAEVAVDGITTVLNAWGISSKNASKVADVMFQTVKLGKTTFEELASSIAIVAPLASSMGVSFEQMAGAVASLTKQGTKTAVAVTQIRAALIGMNKQLGDGWSATMTFNEGAQAMVDKAKGSQNELQRLAASVEAVGAILAVTGEKARGAAKDYEAMTSAVGEMGKAFGEQTKALDFKIKKISEQWDAFLQTAAEVSVEFATAMANISSMVGGTFEGLFTFLVDGWNSVARAIDNVLGIQSGIAKLPPGALRENLTKNFDFLKKSNLPGVSVTPKAGTTTTTGEPGSGLNRTGSPESIAAYLGYLDYITKVKTTKNIPLKGLGFGADDLQTKDAFGVKIAAANIRDEFGLAAEDFGTDLLSGVSSAGNLMADLLGDAAKGFTDVLMSGLGIISQVLNISSGFGFSGLFGLFAAKGGTFEGGKKVASFAGGGDFMVPGTGTSDSFPMVVAPGERVKITPSSRVGEESKLLAKVLGAIQAMNMNLINLDNSITVVNTADVKTTVLKNKSQENTLTKAGVNFDEL